MKRKSLLAIIIILALGLASIYIFIPSRIGISNMVILSCTKNGADRFLMNDDNWKKWWPGTVQSNTNNPAEGNSNTSFLYNDDSFVIEKKNFGWTTISIKHYGNKTNSRLNIASLGRDTILIEWQCELPKLLNPVSKILQYNRAVKLKQNMQDV
jgi:hypothetical protein